MSSNGNLILDPNDSQPRKPVNERRRPTIRNTGITIFATLASVTAFFFGSSVLLQLLCSFYLFFLLNPVVKWAESKRIPRKIGSIFVVLFLLIFTVGAGWGSYGAIADLANEIPQYEAKIKKTIVSLEGQAAAFQKGTNNMMPQAGPKDDVQKVEVVEKFGGGIGHSLLAGMGQLAELLAAGFLIPILLLFLLLEQPSLYSALSEAAPPSFRIVQVGRELTEMCTGFFLGNVLVGFGTAIGFYALFTILGLENRLLLALVAGFINLIPMVGAVLGGLLPMMQAFLQFETMGPAIWVLSVSVFLHFFVANFVIPKIVGSKINVNATAATIGLIFWGWLWGPLGLLLAVPLTATIRIFLSAQKSTEAWAKLIAENAEGEATRMSLPKPVVTRERRA